MKSLEEIIADCQRGKTRAQADLYARYADKMFGLCRYYSSGYSDAEDLLHDGFLKVFENIGQYRGGHFEAWMRKVFVNLALMRYRKRKKESDVDTGLLPEKGQEDTRVEAGEIMLMVSRLPEQYRLVFNLYAIEGYKHREIAVMLGISEGTSKSNLSRARQHLKDMLEEKKQ